MRDHRNLLAFQKAKELAKLTYQCTASFPQEEKYGLVSQMRRCSVSIGSNIVEGAARFSQQDFIRFLDIAFASSKELSFQVELSQELGFLSEQLADQLSSQADEVSRILHGLMESLRRKDS